MSERFARSLGTRPHDLEYASAISGPRPRHNGFGYWLIGLCLLAAMVSSPYWWGKL